MDAADNITVKIEVKASDLVDACIKALIEDGTLTEIVRCKDCKWYDLTDPCGTLTPNAHRCKRVTRLWIEDDAYCSYGERRDDAEIHRCGLDCTET